MIETGIAAMMAMTTGTPGCQIGIAALPSFSVPSTSVASFQATLPRAVATAEAFAASRQFQQQVCSPWVWEGETFLAFVFAFQLARFAAVGATAGPEADDPGDPVRAKPD
jgi:hypothetical protein